MTTAARLHNHGEKLHIDDVELPEPGPDEVLVELAYAGVNPVDRYVAEGRVAPDGPLPRTLGSEASGHVDGEPVVVAQPALGSRRDGVWASAAVVPRAAVVPVPEGVSLRDAAAMGVAGLTAWNVVTMGGVGPRDRVLVLGASGGVGLSVVSYAASRGAEVIGQTGHQSKAAAVSQQGAGRVVVGDADSLADQLGDWQPTVVIDPLGGGFTAAAMQLLPFRGRHVIFGTSAGAEATLNLQYLYRNGLQVVGYGGLQLSDDERREGLSAALRALADGDLCIVVDEVVPLAEVDRAFQLLADRTITGKVVLDLQ